MTTRPLLLDLFCGAGGAAVGYHRAGYDVIGVDINPQPRYPFKFYQADALQFAAQHGRDFAIIHASPPCQAYTTLPGTFDYPKLIPETREVISSCNPAAYIIENVAGARRELLNPILLCGEMFGLKTYRHRWFEVAPFVLSPAHPKHIHSCPASGRGAGSGGHISVTGNGGAIGLPMPYLDYASLAMGIDWMRREEISQAIPPAYTQFLGRKLLRAIQ